LPAAGCRDTFDFGEEPVTDQDLVGRTIADKYRIKRLLGTGGMGAVFEGEHVEIGKRVAVKVINAAHAGSEEVAERFRREARAASKVESENIVHVFDVGRDPRVGLYMVMEFLVGEDLAMRLERDKRLAPDIAVPIALQAARGLARAHAAGVIHRDLKPANLFLTEREDGSTLVKVVDFGISKLTDDARSPRTSDAPRAALTRAGVVMGTAQYMSPEQAQGCPVDLRTDVWSLGAVLYEALAGRSAFPEMATYEQTIIQIVTKRPTPLAEIAPWVSPELSKLVGEAMTPELDKRLRDCALFARRLVELGSQGPSSAARQVVIHPSGSGSSSAIQGSAATMALGVGPTPQSPANATTLATGEGVAIGPSLRPRPSRGLLLAIGAGAASLLAATVIALWAHGSRDTAPSGLSQSVSLAPTLTASAEGPVAQPGSAATALPPAMDSAVATASAAPSSSAPAIAPLASATATAKASSAPSHSAQASNPRMAKPPPAKPDQATQKGQIGGVGLGTQY
jgi:serine/threonine protein kinase